MSAPLVRTKNPGIYSRGNRYVVKERDQTGRIQTRSAATLAEARSIKAQIRTDSARGEFRPRANAPFDGYAIEWIDNYTGRTSRGFKKTTRQDYKRDLERHAIPFFGSMQLADIEPRDIKRFAQRLADTGLAQSTVRRIVASVKAMLATAFEDSVIRTNPAANVRLATKYKTDKPTGQHARALSDRDLAVVLAQIPEKDLLPIELLASTGMRVGEMIALRWSDVDLSERTVHIARRLHRGEYDAPKSRYGVRTVPLTEHMTKRLTEHRLAQRNSGASDPVLQTRCGTPLSASNLLRRTMKPAALAAGVPWATLHTLRHTFATRCFKHGCNVKQVQMLLGHHSAAFTLEAYIHLLPEDLPALSFLDDLPRAGDGNRILRSDAAF